MSKQCPNPEASAALEENCDFYYDCLEPTFQCGPTGYPIGYGGKYCTSFMQQYKEFSTSGKAWIDGTLTCLKSALVPVVHDSADYSCDRVNTTAFNSHVKCYVSNGFCDLAFGIEHPIQTAEFIADLCKVYQVKDFMSLIAIEQIAEVVAVCAHIMPVNAPTSGLMNLLNM